MEEWEVVDGEVKSTHIIGGYLSGEEIEKEKSLTSNKLIAVYRGANSMVLVWKENYSPKLK